MAPESTQPDLKAERIQSRLKAERIQSKIAVDRLEVLLAGVPEWGVGEDRRSLRRVYRFPTPRAAALFVQLATEIGEAVGRAPMVRLRPPEVTLVVGGAEGEGDRPEGVVEADFTLARALDGRA